MAAPTDTPDNPAPGGSDAVSLADYLATVRRAGIALGMMPRDFDGIGPRDVWRFVSDRLAIASAEREREFARHMKKSQGAVRSRMLDRLRMAQEGTAQEGAA